MELSKYWVFSWVLGIVIRTSTPCISRYTTEPIDGYFCNLPVYKNMSDTSFKQCTYACIGSKTCWALSYNYPGRYCLLSEEPCVAAKLSSDFSMMIWRIGETKMCLEWVPFNRSYGIQHGYPRRAAQVTVGNGRSTAVARVVNDQDILIGRTRSDKHVAELLDGNQIYFEFHHGYEILVIRESCSSTWVPYTPHDPIPFGAVVARKDNNNKKHFVVSKINNGLLRIGGYTEGANFAYYKNRGDPVSFSDMLLLISLGWKRLPCWFQYDKYDCLWKSLLYHWLDIFHTA